MIRYTGIDDTGRIIITTPNKEYANDSMIEFDFPNDFDFNNQRNWRIDEGELVYDEEPMSEELKEQITQNKIRKQIEIASIMMVQTNASALADDQALSVSLLFKIWDSNSHYVTGDIVQWLEDIWRCRQDHDSQEAWSPDQAHSLWGRIVPSGVIEEWRQPTPGLFDGYEFGQRVTHNGKMWESTYNGLNVWEPGASGTEALWKEVN